MDVSDKGALPKLQSASASKTFAVLDEEEINGQGGGGCPGLFGADYDEDKPTSWAKTWHSIYSASICRGRDQHPTHDLAGADRIEGEGEGIKSFFFDLSREVIDPAHLAGLREALRNPAGRTGAVAVEAEGGAPARSAPSLHFARGEAPLEIFTRGGRSEPREVSLVEGTWHEREFFVLSDAKERQIIAQSGRPCNRLPVASLGRTLGAADAKNGCQGWQLAPGELIELMALVYGINYAPLLWRIKCEDIAPWLRGSSGSAERLGQTSLEDAGARVGPVAGLPSEPVDLAAADACGAPSEEDVLTEASWQYLPVRDVLARRGAPAFRDSMPFAFHLAVAVHGSPEDRAFSFGALEGLDNLRGAALELGERGQTRALENFEYFYALPRGTVTLEQDDDRPKKDKKDKKEKKEKKERRARGRSPSLDEDTERRGYAPSPRGANRERKDRGDQSPAVSPDRAAGGRSPRRSLRREASRSREFAAASGPRARTPGPDDGRARTPSPEDRHYDSPSSPRAPKEKKEKKEKKAKKERKEKRDDGEEGGQSLANEESREKKEKKAKAQDDERAGTPADGEQQDAYGDDERREKKSKKEKKERKSRRQETLELAAAEEQEHDEAAWRRSRSQRRGLVPGQKSRGRPVGGAGAPAEASSAKTEEVVVDTPEEARPRSILGLISTVLGPSRELDGEGAAPGPLPQPRLPPHAIREAQFADGCGRGLPLAHVPRSFGLFRAGRRASFAGWPECQAERFRDGWAVSSTEQGDPMQSRGTAQITTETQRSEDSETNSFYNAVLKGAHDFQES
ncbi:unnamed protein product [Prorocentrum cordatum]|uniref:Uncharacterized protein n=1 Tax=Prorocentrum cordatum TaxID=2364126 RepID=A0ABN9W707_9DINO|nr:unnamed protein product [Polarella glacialis]